MKKIRVSLIAAALVLSVGAAFGTSNFVTSNDFDCSSVPNGPLDRSTADCDGEDVTCCYQGDRPILTEE
mgnify:CR=1 FL=1